MWVFAATLCCGLTTTFTACSKDDVKDIFESVNLVGTWKGTGSVSPSPSTEIEFIFDGTTTFNSDHTFTNTDDDGTQTRGEWKLNKQELTMTQTIDGVKIIQVFSIDDNWTRDTMVLTTIIDDEDINGNVVHYTLTITLHRVM